MEQVLDNAGTVAAKPVRRISWLGATPFIAIHVLAFGSIWTGITPAAAICCAVLYFVRIGSKRTSTTNDATTACRK
jgi:hypothetical protein